MGNFTISTKKSIDSREEDGLLGMSFLEKFVIRIDANDNKLVLEEFNP